MIIYLAVGIPVVVSPIGANKNILRQAEVGLAATTANDWFEALRLLFLRSRPRGRSGQGRETTG